MDQMHQRAALLLQPEVPDHRLHKEHDDDARGHTDSNDGEKGGVPVPMAGEIETCGEPQHLARGKGGGNHTHYPAAHFQREKIRDDG